LSAPFVELRAEILRIARDVAPADLVDLLVDWHRAADLGETGIRIIDHETAALVAALQYPPDTADTFHRVLALSAARLVLEPRIARFVHQGGEQTRVAIEAVRAALDAARGKGRAA
jgi:hypothetical protein